MAPGSMPPDATDIEQEGLRIPPIRLDDGLVELIVTSSRTPDERRGDLDAQRGANRLGVERMAAVVEGVGSAAPLAEIVDYGERRMRAALGPPRWRWRFDDVLDSAGPRPDQQSPTRSHGALLRRRRRGALRLHRHRRGSAPATSTRWTQ